jgi:hypothetical protein
MIGNSPPRSMNDDGVCPLVGHPAPEVEDVLKASTEAVPLARVLQETTLGSPGTRQPGCTLHRTICAPGVRRPNSKSGVQEDVECGCVGQWVTGGERSGEAGKVGKWAPGGVAVEARGGREDSASGRRCAERGG